VVRAAVFTLPVFVSHFSARTDQPTLRWWLTGFNDFGVAVTTPPRTQPVKWERARVTSDVSLDVRVPGSRPFTGALAMELLDSAGKRIAANFVNIATRYASSPRIEAIDPRTVALRFAPIEVNEEVAESGKHAGKFWAANRADVSYRVTLPDWVVAADPEQIDVLAEMGTRAGAAKLDWPWLRKALDYPQTDAHKYPGKVRILISGVDAGEVSLPDDPADIRGFLSSVAGFHHSSYGYPTRVSAGAPTGARELIIRILATNGVSIYGEGMGRYGFDPVVLVHTRQDVKANDQ
jgi:hypothetical protein